MPTPLRVLVLEDRPADAELMVHELRRAGFEPDWRRVETEPDYLAYLDPALDVILADYRLPQFNALRALQLLQERQLDIPFIVVTGSLGDEVAVGFIKMGGADYLLKDRLSRLGEAVKNALEQKRLRAEHKQAVEELRKLNLDLERRVVERTIELEAAYKELKDFSYTISHDLQAPLRAMQGFARALQEDYADRLDPIGQDYGRRIVAAAARMDAMIHDLLGYTRLSHAEYALQPVGLAAVVQEALSQLEGEFQERGAQVEVAVPETVPCIMAHHAILVQVVVNLLANAVKFVRPGVQAQVRVWVEDRGRWMRLWVEDNGIGIAPEHQDRIFRVFERLHGVETYPGTGIGLAVVRKGVERMRSRVGLESVPGQGSRFWVELQKEEGRP